MYSHSAVSSLPSEDCTDSSEEKLNCEGKHLCRIAVRSAVRGPTSNLTKVYPTYSRVLLPYSNRVSNPVIFPESRSNLSAQQNKNPSVPALQSNCSTANRSHGDYRMTAEK